ncbi:MAG: hypothetical protein ACLTR6_09045 [Clostridium fessum]
MGRYFPVCGENAEEKIKILQSLFVPVSLLAGFIGLALGLNGFGIISFSSQFGSYAGLLIIAVFVSIGLRGFNFSAGGWKTNFDRIGSYYCFRNIGWAFQYAMPIIFAMVVPENSCSDLNPAFGMLIPAGFQGGSWYSVPLARHSAHLDGKMQRIWR